MVDHVKFLMHLRLYGMLQYNHLGPNWRMGSFTNILGPGPHKFMYTATEHRHVSQDSLFSTIYSATIYQWMPAVSRIVFQSLTVAPIEALFVNFCVTKIRQNFFRRHLKENGMLKILATCNSGAPFQLGALRTCVPCLMVNPALMFS